MARTKNQRNSAVVIAQLLSTEGFTDHVAGEVTRYWMRSSGLTDRQTRKIKRLKAEIGKMCEKLSEGEKLVLGRFLGLHKKMSFDTGLRIGITAFAHHAPIETCSEHGYVSCSFCSATAEADRG